MFGFKLGKNVFIGMKCYFDDMEPNFIKIEGNVIISFQCCFVIHGCKQEYTKILIKENAYIGCRAPILSGKSGIVIGKNAIIGACSLVNKNIPDDETWGGEPAKKIN